MIALRVGDRIVQALEVVSDLGGIRRLWKTQSVPPAHDLQYWPGFQPEEVLQAYT